MTTGNSAGNLLASTTVSHTGTPVTFNVDVSAKFEAQIQLSATFGTVAATAGLQVTVYRRIGSGPAVDTNAVTQFVVPAVASTTSLQSFALPTGRYQVSLKDLDTTNDVTSVTATDDTVDSVA